MRGVHYTHLADNLRLPHSPTPWIIQSLLYFRRFKHYTQHEKIQLHATAEPFISDLENSAKATLCTCHGLGIYYGRRHNNRSGHHCLQLSWLYNFTAVFVLFYMISLLIRMLCIIWKSDLIIKLFWCSEHDPVPHGSDMRGSTVISFVRNQIHKLFNMITAF